MKYFDKKKPLFVFIIKSGFFLFKANFSEVEDVLIKLEKREDSDKE